MKAAKSHKGNQPGFTNTNVALVAPLYLTTFDEIMHYERVLKKKVAGLLTKWDYRMTDVKNGQTVTLLYDYCSSRFAFYDSGQSCFRES